MTDRRIFDQDILSLSEVAELLHCTEDTLRRVPNEELPAYRVGRKNLYFREDVIRFVRSKRVRPSLRNPQNSAEKLSEADIDALIQDVLDSDQVDARKRSERKAS
jgi:excisionase family DNA binding protein